MDHNKEYPEVWIIAKTNIRNGDELTYSYGRGYWCNSKKRVCKCGEVDCYGKKDGLLADGNNSAPPQEEELLPEQVSSIKSRSYLIKRSPGARISVCPAESRFSRPLWLYDVLKGT